MQRAERADAARNRQAIMDAANVLFANSPSPSAVTMDDIAAAAGVGKGTLFRRFGSRTGLIRQLYARQLAPLRQRITSGPSPLGPSAPAGLRVPAIVAAIAELKFQNMHLTAALEAAGGDESDLYSSPGYRDVHGLLTGLLTPSLAPGRAAWTAHLLLAAVRADLLRHLVRDGGMTADQVRAQLRAFTGQIVSGLH